MQFMIRCLLAATLVASTCVVAAGQICDSGGSVALTINGQTPSAANPTTHVVDVPVNDTLTLAVSNGNAATPFILAIGSGTMCNAIGVPWGGSIDLAAPSVLLDGFFGVTPFDALARTDFSVSVFIPCSAAGMSGPAFQAVHSEPANAPFFLDNTQAGGTNYVGVFSTVYTTVGDDTFVTHNLGCGGSGGSILFGGVTYTQVFAGSNGMVTFGTGSGDFSVTTAEFHAGFRPSPSATDNPGIAVLWGDFFEGIVTNDDITITEDVSAGTLRVRWNNVQWWDSDQPAGTFHADVGTMGPGSVVIDVSGAIAGLGGTDQNPIIGVTDGNSAVGIDTTVDISADLAGMGGTHVSPPGVGGESFCEQFPMAGSDPTQPLDILTLTFLPLASPFEWVIF